MLSIRQLSKIYGDGLLALSQIDFEVAAGEVAMLLGASGCGKTSLLRILAGLEAATTGEVQLEGKAIVEPHPAISLVFQEPRLMPWLTVEQNVAFGLRHMPRPARAVEVAAMLERVGLYAKRAKLPRELSGGQQQRVALARALVTQPDVLLLDEPFSALDAMTRETLQDQLLELLGANAPTIIMVTHDVEEALYLGDRVFVLQPDPGTLAGIVDLGRDRRVRLRRDAAQVSARERIRELLDARSSRVTRVIGASGIEPDLRISALVEACQEA